MTRCHVQVSNVLTVQTNKNIINHVTCSNSWQEEVRDGAKWDEFETKTVSVAICQYIFQNNRIEKLPIQFAGQIKPSESIFPITNTNDEIYKACHNADVTHSCTTTRSFCLSCEMGKCTSYWFQIFSGFNTPKIIKNGYFWKSYLKNKKVFWGTQCIILKIRLQFD